MFIPIALPIYPTLVSKQVLLFKNDGIYSLLIPLCGTSFDTSYGGTARIIPT
jgi:hypothetical protein